MRKDSERGVFPSITCAESMAWIDAPNPGLLKKKRNERAHSCAGYKLLSWTSAADLVLNAIDNAHRYRHATPNSTPEQRQMHSCLQPADKKDQLVRISLMSETRLWQYVQQSAMPKVSPKEMKNEERAQESISSWSSCFQGKQATREPP